MKNFIEIINTDDERILINVSNIVKVDEMNERTNKVIKDLKKTTDNLEFIAKLIGDDLIGEDFNKEVSASINAASKAKTMITLNGAWTNQNSSTMIYTNETYDEICKKIGEAL